SASLPGLSAPGIPGRKPSLGVKRSYWGPHACADSALANVEAGLPANASSRRLHPQPFASNAQLRPGHFDEFLTSLCHLALLERCRCGSPLEPPTCIITLREGRV